MRYSPRDMVSLTRTPLGRAELLLGAERICWPALAPLAARYRALAIPDTPLVAVVGSLGKTTSARAACAALGLPIHWRIGRNFQSGLARNILRIRPHARGAVVEVGIDGPGQMARLGALVQPALAVVTSIASEHLRAFGSPEALRDEKAHMLRALPAHGWAVLNGDDPNVRWMAGQTMARVLTFGLEPDCDVRASDLGLDWPAGMRFTLHLAGSRRAVRTRLLGRSMVYPFLAGVAVAHALGIDLDRALARLAALPPTAGRLQPAELPSGAWLLRDEYKSALESVHTSLDLLEQIPARRRLCVLGEVSEPPGSQGPIYRELGRRLATMTARVVHMGGSFQPIATGAARAGMAREALASAGRSAARAVELLGALAPGDVVLVKGRDTQRLERVSLRLQGRAVRCDLAVCYARAFRCDRCPMLSRGWGARSPVVARRAPRPGPHPPGCG